MSTLLDDPGPRIAARLRLERDSRGWSLADLAERSGVSKATISKIEREEVSPTAVILVRLAGAFDLTLWVFGALLALFGLLASIKATTERMTQSWLDRKKRRRLRQQMAAASQPALT